MCRIRHQLIPLPVRRDQPSPPIMWALALFVFLHGTVAMAVDDRDIQFNREVRPILSNKCFQCHGPDPATRAAELEEEFREKFAHPYLAARRGFLDDVIDPRETRARLISGLEMLANKRDRNPPRKHGNIPL